jgi:hypothetical protein
MIRAPLMSGAVAELADWHDVWPHRGARRIFQEAGCFFQEAEYNFKDLFAPGQP